MTTIYDVAKRAKVSPATVSNAFNKPHLLRAETHERIIEAVQELDYKPNVFAQGLAGGKTQMVGLIVADIRYPFTATVARGVEDALVADGSISIISSTDGIEEKTIQLMGQLHRRGVSGFIVIPSYYGVKSELMQAIKSLVVAGVPTVIAGYQLDDPMLDVVTYRSKAGTREIVDYLIELGHQDIAYIGSHHSKGQAANRWLGFQESLLSHQLPIRPELVVETDITPSLVQKEMARLFSLPNPPTAIFAFNDVVSLAIIDFCFAQKIRIPDDLSVVSFDYQTLAQRSKPEVTSVVIPAYEFGQKAAQILLQRQKTPNISMQQISLDYRIEVRETTAAPKSKQ